MVAIQFTNRFFGFQPKVRECGQFLQNLRPELLGVFAAGVEVPCKLVEVASHFAALGRQGGDCGQCVLSALRYYHGVFDIHTVQDAADKCGLGKVKFFAGVFNAQFFFCGHSGIGAILRLPRCAAHNKSAYQRILSHAVSLIKIENFYRETG